MEWYKNLKNVVNHIGLGNILSGDISNPEVEVFKRLVDIFYQNAFAEIKKESSKLRTYGLVKLEAGEEPYLRTVKNVRDRISMSKFRLSNHKLMIEKGRHLNLEKEHRICPFCRNVEDETHFLLHCRNYMIIREDVLKIVVGTLNEELNRNDDKMMLRYLLGNTQISPVVAKYLRKTMELRDFLIDSPKQLT